MAQTLLEDCAFLYKSWSSYISEQRNLSQHTVRAYTSDVKSFLTFILNLNGIDTSKVKEYLSIINEGRSAYLQHNQNRDSSRPSPDCVNLLSHIKPSAFRSWLASKQNPSPQSISRSASSLKNFFQYIARYFDITNKYVKEIKVGSKGLTLPKALGNDSIEQVNKMIFAIPSSEEWVKYRDKAILLLMYGCGLRISEVLGIKLRDMEGCSSDISSDYASIRVMGKGAKERILPLISPVVSAIEEYLKHCPHQINEGPIFVGTRGKSLNPDVFRERIRKLRNITDLPSNASPHSFRHTFATDLLSNDVDIRTIQEMLGHSNISSTQRYTKVNRKQLEEQYRKYNPLFEKEED